MSDKGRLTNMRLRRIALVDEPASQDRAKGLGAFVALFKSADMTACPKCGTAMDKGAKACTKCGAQMKAADAAANTEDAMTLDKVTADLKAAEDLLEEQNKTNEALTKRVADLEKAGSEVATLKAALAATEKSAKDSADLVQKLQDEREIVEFAKKAEALDKIATGKTVEFAAMLRKISKALGADEFKTFEGILAGANAAAAPLHRERGHSGSAGGAQSADAEIATKAQALVEKSGGKLTEAQAMTELSKTEPALFARARREGYAAGNGN